MRDVRIAGLESTRLAGAMVVLFGVAAVCGASPKAVLWADSGRPDVVGVRMALAEAGCEVRKVGGGALAGALTGQEGPDLLVLPYGGDYPAGAAPAIQAFMRGGGGLAASGGTPFTQALMEVGGRWVPAEAGLPGAVPIPLDSPWAEGHAYAGVVFEMSPMAEPAFTRFSVKELQGYGYTGTRLPAIAFSDGVLAFGARDAGDTPRLCVELTARDGSRWKSVIATGPNWREYRIHLADFVSYNNTKRGEKGDYCRAHELRHVMFGFTAGMVGTGPRAFDLRELQLEPAAVPGGLLKAAPRFKQLSHSVGRWFGKFTGIEEFQAAPFPDGAFVEGCLVGCDADETAVWSAAEFCPPKFQSSERKLHERFKDAARVLFEPLLSIRRADGVTCPVAGFSAFLAGPGQEGRQLVSGLPDTALVQSAAARQAFSRGLHLVREAVIIAGLEPVFSVEDGKPRLSARVGILKPQGGGETVRTEGKVKLGTAVRSLGIVEGTRDAQAEWLAFPISEPDLLLPFTSSRRSYSVEVVTLPVSGSVLAAPVLGNTQFRVEPLKALFDICTFMRGRLEEQGQLYGNRFIDSRGVRALLAAADIFEDERFRVTALRWVEEKVLAEQRDDGGYRMGYGIGKRGEECYVADGGEIAVCVAQAACHTVGPRREAFLTSLDRYMDYRESFRVESGGIGVGWCLHDYGQRPTVALEKPTRILAPEKNIYTIGCTLAAACAHARLRADAALEQRAEQDADWLMARAKSLNGAYIESYVYAHAATRDPERRKIYTDYMRRVFRDKMVEQRAKDWWLTGGGRTALNLDGLAYWCEAHPEDDGAKLAMLRALAFMFSPDSPQSIVSLMSSGKTLGHDEWIYVCYGTLGLADALFPMVSMERLLGEPRPPGDFHTQEVLRVSRDTQ